jgi:hypothetical protein
MRPFSFKTCGKVFFAGLLRDPEVGFGANQIPKPCSFLVFFDYKEMLE